MKSNLNVILSAVGVAALLASPAMAVQPHNTAPTTVYIPSDARASVARYGINEGGPYTPSIPAPRRGLSSDFQNGNGN